MEENKKLKSDLLPYLKLKESEVILLVNRSSEKYILPIKDLAKYHDPDQLPKKFFPILGDNYEYHDIEIFTNHRVIIFRLNLEYIKDDGVTPVSDIYHIDNYLVWINNEDIKECNIEFGKGIRKGILVEFNFYHDDGEKAKNLPLHIPCSNYPNYLKVKEVLIHPLELNSAKMKYQEQQRVKSIRSFNRSFLTYGMWALALLGLYILAEIIDEEIILNYLDLGLYVLYVIFFYAFNFYWARTLKKMDDETFYRFADKNFTWYIGPSYSIIVFILCALAMFLSKFFSLIFTNNYLSLLAGIGSVACLVGFSLLLGMIIDNKKKKKQDST